MPAVGAESLDTRTKIPRFGAQVKYSTLPSALPLNLHSPVD
jgi:hypothetical protein